MSVPAAERLYELHRPPGWPETLREAAAWYALRDDLDAWERLSHGEVALVRIALSLWGAPGVEVALYRDLGSLDTKHQRSVIAAVAAACRVPA